ncbi:MAG: hypothetical protein HQ536_02800, partial [Parcubacteria group bacterium]|nr:hypothetical protein [Parcubacteria group bacterium]
LIFIYPPTPPEDGFSVVINDGSTVTIDRVVDLLLSGGPDAYTMGISNNSDMSDAISEPYTENKEWDICSISGGAVVEPTCPDGEYTVYVQFYNVYGMATDIISATIKNVNVVGEITPEETIPTEPEEETAPEETIPTEPEEETVPTQPEEISVDTGIEEVIPIQIIAPLAEVEEIIESVEVAEEILSPPTISEVTPMATSNAIDFRGSGIPNSEIIIFIHSEQFLVYNVDVGEDGLWSFRHSQDNVVLAPGEHTVYAITLDRNSKTRSRPAQIRSFIVENSYLSIILSYFDLLTTILTIFVILTGLAYFLLRKGGSTKDESKKDGPKKDQKKVSKKSSKKAKKSAKPIKKEDLLLSDIKDKK